jgi:UDP-N-acetylmuramoyl-tripeptide--D-alanyl-D-alanine ligase
MELQALQKVLSAENVPGCLPNCQFDGVSINSRTIEPQQLFIALEGPRFDGHDYVQDAMNHGAAAALVSRWVACDLPQIKVTDTLHALQVYAAWHRSCFQPTVIAITGSCGKTTTRALLQSILSQVGSVLATEGNLNNHIGVPLMLLRIREEHRFVVLELGASHVGEIAQLASWVKPHCSVITNAGRAHIEGFGSLARVAQGKGEVYQALPSNGIAVVNLDDVYSGYWKSVLSGQRQCTFACHQPADLTALHIRSGFDQQFDLCLGEQNLSVTLPMLGEHNVYNALAAASVATALGVDLDAVKTGLEQSCAVSGRLAAKRGWNGALIIDDAYNANPRSVSAAIEMLQSLPDDHQRVLVIADMKELGEQAEAWHREIGALARAKGVEHLLTMGQLAQYCGEAFGPDADHFSDYDALIDRLKTMVDKNSAVVIKGSNSMGMQRVVEALL